MKLVWLALTCLVLAVPGASAAQDFFFAPEGRLSTSLEDLHEPVSAGISACAGVCVNAYSESVHSFQVTEAGSVRPVSARLHIEATQDTFAAGVGSQNICPMTLYFFVHDSDGEWKGGWYYCTFPGIQGAVILAGMHELDLSYRDDLSPIDVQPGDWVGSSVWTYSTSTHALPTLHLVSDADHPSFLTLAGTNEPMPEQAPEPEPTPDPEPTQPAPSSTSSPPASGTTTAPSTTTTTAPAQAATSAGAPPEDRSAPVAQEQARKSPGIGPILLAALCITALMLRRARAGLP